MIRPPYQLAQIGAATMAVLLLAQSFAYQEKRQRAAGTMQLAVNRLAADTGINLVLDGIIGDEVFAVEADPQSELGDVTPKLIERIKKVAAAQTK